MDASMRRMFECLFEIKSMSAFQLVGEIFARAQLLEEFMRVYIVNGSKKYNHPREIGGTFGVLRGKFSALYPKEKMLLDWLEAANETRNDVAHSEFLVSRFIGDLLKGHGIRKSEVDRFNHRTLEKMFHVMDTCLMEFRKFSKKHPPKLYDLKVFPKRRKIHQ